MITENPANAWEGLECTSGQVATFAAWERRLGTHAAAVRQAFLRRSQVAALSVPCPRGCGCEHTVIATPSGLVGVCSCPEWGCDNLALQPEDVVLWELNLARLGRALCEALQLQPRSPGLALPGTTQIGAWSTNSVPVLLTIQSEQPKFNAVLAELCARIARPFILLAPTTRFLTASGQQFLSSVRAELFALKEIVTLLPRARLQPRKPPGELFRAFNPDPVADDAGEVARKAFAIVQQLDTEQPLKPPTLVTVFTRYCMDGLSAGQIARKHNCSKPTVLRRLEKIRQRTGVAPQQLRSFSPHLQQLESSMNDSRARKIYRPHLIEETEEE